jgi:hypothetical protein
MLLRAWLVDKRVAAMHLRPMHLYLPHRSRVRHDRTVRA